MKESSTISAAVICCLCDTEFSNLSFKTLSHGGLRGKDCVSAIERESRTINDRCAMIVTLNWIYFGLIISAIAANLKFSTIRSDDAAE